MTQLYTESTQSLTLPAGRWTVDPAHSSIEFWIKHLLITTVKGTVALMRLTDELTRAALRELLEALVERSERLRALTAAA